jgi:hypothetical protein
MRLLFGFPDEKQFIGAYSKVSKVLFPKQQSSQQLLSKGSTRSAEKRDEERLTLPAPKEKSPPACSMQGAMLTVSLMR